MPLSNAVFISYRRSDSNDVTGRISDRLIAHFGREVVFKDVHSIPYGVDFRIHIRQAVERCQVLIAVIGPTWLTVTDAQGDRRLDNPDDWVRIEIETALARNIPVIPLLVGNAKLPRAAELPEGLQNLAYRNAAPARPNPDFDVDLSRLIRRLEDIVGVPNTPTGRSTPAPSSSTRAGFYARQIAQLEEQLAAVTADLASAPRGVDRLRLEKEAENLLNEIEALKSKLDSL